MRGMFSLATIVASAGIFCPGCGDDPDDSTAIAFRDLTDGSTGEPDDGTTGDPDPGPQTGGPDTGGPDDEICGSYGAWLSMCDPLYGDEFELVAQCEQFRAEYGAVFGSACASLADAALECYTDSACADDTACAAELQAYQGCQPPVGELCAAYGARMAECDRGVAAEEAESCQLMLNYWHYYSPACGAAHEQFIACDLTHACGDLGVVAGCEAAATELSESCQ